MVNKDGGIKYDDDKPRWDLLPLNEIEDVVKILTFGAKKYEPNNWKKVEPHRYVAATFRHLLKWLRGDTKDDETGISHLAHAICNLLFLAWFERKGKIDKSLFELNSLDDVE